MNLGDADRNSMKLKELDSASNGLNNQVPNALPSSLTLSNGTPTIPSPRKPLDAVENDSLNRIIASEISSNPLPVVSANGDLPMEPPSTSHSPVSQDQNEDRPFKRPKLKLTFSPPKELSQQPSSSTVDAANAIQDSKMEESPVPVKPKVSRRSSAISNLSRRNSSRIKEMDDPADLDPSICYPITYLPSASYIKSYPRYKTDEIIVSEIKEFFHSPVPFFGPESASLDYGVDMCGTIMEYRLRKLVGADLQGMFEDLAGYAAEPSNPFIEYICKELNTTIKKQGSGMSQAKKLKKMASIYDAFLDELSDTYDDDDLSDTDSLTDLSELEEMIDGVIRPKKKKRKIRRKVKYVSTLGEGPWGHVAERFERLWAGPMDMIYQRKCFIQAGIYFDAVRMPSLEQAGRLEFRLPVLQGAVMMDTETEFELPYDILKAIDIMGGADKVCLSSVWLISDWFCRWSSWSLVPLDSDVLRRVCLFRLSEISTYC